MENTNEAFRFFSTAPVGYICRVTTPNQANMWEKLKNRWNVNSGMDVLAILVVFACTGFSVLYAKRIIFDWMNITDQTQSWVRFLLSIFIILPIYQVILLGWGWIFGKFNFFWEFEKRTLARMRGILRRKI